MRLLQLTQHRNRGGPIFLEGGDERFAVVPEVVTTELRTEGPFGARWSLTRPASLYLIDRAGVSRVPARDRGALPLVLCALVVGLALSLIARRK